MMRFSYKHGIVAFFALLVLVLVYQGVREAKIPNIVEQSQPSVACKGTPIVVDFTYTGGVAEPHSCKLQCEDGLEHFVLYANGMATQCEALHGCNDYGEDNGVTCEPPQNL